MLGGAAGGVLTLPLFMIMAGLDDALPELLDCSSEGDPSLMVGGTSGQPPLDAASIVDEVGSSASDDIVSGMGRGIINAGNDMAAVVDEGAEAAEVEEPGVTDADADADAELGSSGDANADAGVIGERNGVWNASRCRVDSDE